MQYDNWTSGNDDIDEFIQDTQLSTHDKYEVSKKALEWIPYNRLCNIKYNEKIGVFRANWIDGYIYNWDIYNQNWERYDQNMFVTLKRINLNNIKLEVTNKINGNYEFYGITQDPKTKNYMMILSDLCEKCDGICEFHKKFINWTSGNNNIDKFIQDTQLLAHYDLGEALEWIPYDRFYDIKYIAKGGYGKVYKAIWNDGKYRNMLVALKSLNNSRNITLEFMNEIALHSRFNNFKNFIIKFYGITQNPETKDYIMVLNYAEGGSLRNYLDTNHNELNWNSKLNHLLGLACGLDCIHKNEFIHRDLHSGNILISLFNMWIADMGLCKPADCNPLESAKNNIYGVLSYIAPEILRRQNYTKASDIYSFGIIMYEIISGLPPYHDISHDENLAIKICKGFRPRFNIKVPQLIIYLIKRCLDADPLNRPQAEEIYDILHEWINKKSKSQTVELQKQIKEAEEINKNSSNDIISLTNLGMSYETHSEAIYTSRILNFNNLPEPKNSDDYYKQTDNIISGEFSGIN
ncbi:Ypk2p [Rhizophagus irregularis DAOM 197198w]|uniref:Ypk2p n=1 Tax=Rhizophagus irregularis (strain DAOM 197198w) TaxID=1432141 RepID=A0A015LSN6_RHIIW|nr:Ypk2p [Rhizophagus irregularis DAOM 197198w]